MKKRNRFHLLRDENGASLVELAFVLPLFPLLLFGVVDFGRAFYVSVEIAGAAQAAAVYGSQNPTDTTGMQTAAQDDAPNVPNLSVGTPTYGCECSDGTTTAQALGPADVSRHHRSIPRQRHGDRNLFAVDPLARCSFVDVAYRFGVDAQRRQLEAA